MHAGLILAAILNILFFPCIWGHKSLLESAEFCQSVLPNGASAGELARMRWARTRDSAAAAWFFEPSLALTGSQYKKEHVIPLWNPYQAYGTPLAANMQSQPFYPLTILLSLDVTARSYNLFLLARLFVAGLFGYLFLRLFVSFVPALGAGIAMMLGGYFVLYVDMPHLSVETLIPAALFTAERLLRSGTYGRFVAFTLVLVLAVLGGMPESTFLLFTLLYTYMVFRIWLDPVFRLDWLRLSGRVFAASILGLSLSSILLLPFLEFMRHGYDTHQPRNTQGVIIGLAHESRGSTVFAYLLPLIYGPYHGLINYFGIISLFLALVALLAGFRGIISAEDRRLRQLTLFFLLGAIALILKRYGIEPVTSIGRLPLFRYVVFYKYEEPLLTVCMGVLCGIGLERILKGRATRGVLAGALGASIGAVVLAWVAGQSTIASAMKTDQFPARMTEIAFGVAILALFGGAICVIGFGTSGPRIALAILTVLTIDASVNYIPDLYYIDSGMANDSRNPYSGAPYIKFLKEKCGAFERVFARDSILFPDWASVFQLQDIRDLDAMYYWKYLPFVRNFVAANLSDTALELRDRFTGEDAEYGFSQPLEKRLLQLSSAKYLVSRKPYEDTAFRLAYDREVKIYEYDDVLPRAAIYFRAELADGETQTLKKLADPGLNVFQSVVINRSGIHGQLLQDLKRINQGEARPVTAAKITSYASQEVRIEASLDRPGVLVLNDSDYPGWNVSVDGAQARGVNANFLFRGVVLSRGKHVIRFVYRPRTFYMGALLSSAAAIVLLILAFPRARAYLNSGKSQLARRMLRTRMVSHS